MGTCGLVRHCYKKTISYSSQTKNTSIVFSNNSNDNDGEATTNNLLKIKNKQNNNVKPKQKATNNSLNKQISINNNTNRKRVKFYPKTTTLNKQQTHTHKNIKEERYKQQLNQTTVKGTSKYYNKNYTVYSEETGYISRSGSFHVEFKAQKCERLILFWIPENKKVSFSVTGLWSIDREYFGTCNEEGYDYHITNELNNGYNVGALIGRVMGSKKYFNIKNNYEFVSEISGPLLLSMNLSKRYIDSDNVMLSGFLDILVKNVETIISIEQLEDHLNTKLFDIPQISVAELSGFERKVLFNLNKLRDDPKLFAVLYLGGETKLPYLPNNRAIEKQEETNNDIILNEKDVIYDDKKKNYNDDSDENINNNNDDNDLHKDVVKFVFNKYKKNIRYFNRNKKKLNKEEKKRLKNIAYNKRLFQLFKEKRVFSKFFSEDEMNDINKKIENNDKKMKTKKMELVHVPTPKLQHIPTFKKEDLEFYRMKYGSNNASVMKSSGRNNGNGNSNSSRCDVNNTKRKNKYGEEDVLNKKSLNQIIDYNNKEYLKNILVKKESNDEILNKNLRKKAIKEDNNDDKDLDNTEKGINNNRNDKANKDKDKNKNEIRIKNNNLNNSHGNASSDNSSINYDLKKLSINKIEFPYKSSSEDSSFDLSNIFYKEYDNEYNQRDYESYMNHLFLKLLAFKYNLPKFTHNSSLSNLAKFLAKDLADTGQISQTDSYGLDLEKRVSRLGKKIIGLVEIIHTYSDKENPLSLVVKVLMSYCPILKINLSEYFVKEDLLFIGIACEIHSLEGNVLVIELAESIV